MILSPDDIQKLSVAERLALIEALWDSIPNDPDALPLTNAQKQEIDRHLDRYERERTTRESVVEADDAGSRNGGSASEQRPGLDDQQLIEKHVGMDYDLFGGRADARLKKSGVSVWAIVTYLGVYEGDVDEVARTYALSPEEMAGALAYYRQNKKFVDARVLLNEA